MSSFIVPGKNSIFMGAQAFILDESKEVASDNWIRDHVVPNEALKWISGRFVEADNPNDNRQMWTHADLRMAEPTIKYAPMNVLHQPSNIVGSFVATKMMYPVDETAELGGNPYIEALGAFWRAYFPDTFNLVERAHNDGSLFFSMECIGESVTFIDRASGQEETFPFMGSIHESYGEWNNNKEAIRQINKPHFLGGALILPPTKPGWSNADVTAIAKYVENHVEDAERVYQEIASASPQLSAKQIEDITVEFMRRTMDESGDSSINADSTPKENLTSPELDLSMTSDSEGDGGEEVNTYTQEEFDAALEAALSPVKAELEALRADADASAVETQITEIREQAQAEVEELQKKLDNAVLAEQAAKDERDAIVAWLESEAQAAAEAAALAERREERVGRVKEVASFPEDHLAANADRWAAMSDEDFDALLADYEAAAKASLNGKGEELEDEGSDSVDAPAATAMKASRDESRERTLGASLGMLRGVDFSTL